MAPGILHPPSSGTPSSMPSNVPSNGPLLEGRGDQGTTDRLEPIAVVGFSLKFPQEATSPNAFWDMLVEKRCAMTEWPKERLHLEAFYHPDTNRLDTVPVRGAHFLKEHLGAFDAPFFSMTSLEAMSMDPQHRIMLETAYRALENSGITMENVFGSKTGVYTGSFADDYKLQTLRDLETLPKYAVTGVTISLLANRLSWFYNLNGPSCNIDTACSSSMVALDVACQGLRNKDSTMALVGGSSTVLGLESFLSLTNLNMLSPDGRCYSFDEHGNGYARGEGCGVLVLKLLSNAIQDGDTIRAVIRSTGSNQDGRTPGITQPSREAQENLIRDTYEKAGLDMRFTRFFEAHGTGTALGDPTEASAIGAVFRKHRSSQEPLYIGAVKSNIGHLEGASGIAGVIKAILALEKGIIPPNTNFKSLNPRIDAEFLNIKFPLSSIPWPSSGLRRVSVNSFGFGGSNSHTVLDDAYNYLHLRGLTANHCTTQTPPTHKEECSSSLETNGNPPEAQLYQNGVNGSCSTLRPKLLLWSAGDEGGLARIQEAYNRHFYDLSLHSSEEHVYLENLAYTLAFRRSSLPWKSFAIASSMSDLRKQGISLSKPVRSSKKLGIAYIFTGQGAQFAEMGRDLLAYSVFKKTIQRAEICLRGLGCKWSLLHELLKDMRSSKVNQPEYSQPLCTVLQIALVELLRSWNVKPSAVIGHSSGEIAAAYCAGGLSLESACKVAYFRGKLTDSLARSSQHHGAMLSVGLSKVDVHAYLQRLEPMGIPVTVACINSPRNVTLAGDENSINELKGLLDADRIFARKLLVNVAYHSSQMKEIATEYLMSIQDLKMGDQSGESLTMISSVTAAHIPTAELCQSEYWVQNMVSPVKFADALILLTMQSASLKKKLRPSNQNTTLIYDLLEVGPHSALQGPTKDILVSIPRGKEVKYTSVLVRNASALDSALNSVGHLYCLGYPVALENVNQTEVKPADNLMALPSLPEYPFDHSKIYWSESRLSKGLLQRKHKRLDLLGTPSSDWNPLEAKWRKFIKVYETPWVKDHKVNGSIIYPATGMLVMAIEGVRQMADPNRHITGYFIKDATFQKPITIPTSPNGIETQVYIRPRNDASDKDSTWSDFRLCVYEEDGSWSDTCQATISVEYESDEKTTEVDGGKESAEKLRSYRQRYEEGSKACTRLINSADMYRHLEQSIGVNYGPAFRVLQNLACNDDGEAIAEIKVFEWVEEGLANHTQPHVIHPVTWDATAQLLLVALTRGGKDIIETTIPTRISNLWVSSSGLSYPSTSSIKCYTKSVFKGYRGTDSALFALDTVTGDLRLSCASLETTNVASRDATSQVQPEQTQLCYNLDWKPDIDMLSPQQLLAYCETDTWDKAEPVEFYQKLELLVYTFVSSAMRQIQERPPTDLKPHLRKYIAWMQHQLEIYSSGNLPHGQPEWVSLSQDENYINALTKHVEATGPEGKLFVEVGQNLLDMLYGTINPLQFLFQSEVLTKYYEDIFHVSCCRQMGRYLDILVHKNPNAKILEVGAGTGGMTTHILQPIMRHGEEELGAPRFAHYDYTDISGSYFGNAQEKFGSQRKKMTFKTLNIEKDPSEQGFEAGTYDLVIASSVLHATRDLNVTMQNVRKLLKPGGKLILFEITRPDILRSGFVFGLLPGWWLAAETHRNWSPCITEEQWHSVLTQTCFSGVDLALQDYREQSCQETGVLISTAIREQPKDLYTGGASIVIDTSSAMQIKMAQFIESGLQSNARSNCNIISVREAAQTKDLTKQPVIFLPEIEKPFLSQLDAQSLADLQGILSSVHTLLWVTRGGGTSQQSPEFGMVNGLARVLRREKGNLAFTTLALDGLETVIEAHAIKVVDVIKSTISQSMEDCEPEFVEQNGVLRICRMVEANYLNQNIHAKTRPHFRTQEFGQGPPLALTLGCPGLLDSLQFVEDIVYVYPLAPHEIEIEVKAVGVNFMDTLTVLGRVNQKTLGGEVAGIVTRAGVACDLRPGDRVCAAIFDCFRTYARQTHELVVKIPDGMSFVEAASLPVTGVTAYYSLVEFARLQKGESVLIHSASGGTGQLAVQIAQLIGAEVYATVGSEEKKQLIMDEYHIPEDHIFYSRNTTFAQGIMRMTYDHGVDVILNSLAGDSLVASWECLASYGRFVEIGKKDIHSHMKLPMYQFRKNVSFGHVDLDSFHRERPVAFRKSLVAVIEMIAKKSMHTALPLHIYPISHLEDAFRYLQSGKNTGKSVVEMKKDSIVPTVLKLRNTYQFDTDATYLISGGLGGIGRSIAYWMAGKGARHLILLSRSGAHQESHLTLLNELRAQGVQVEAPACDVTVALSLSRMLSECKAKMPPIKGCIQAAMVLRDVLFEKMTIEDWNASTNPKVSGSWNLHTLLPRGLDFFINLSSVSGILGAVGQSNYAAGNTYQDSLAHHCVMRGEKAFSLDLGWIAEVGAVAESEFLQKGFAATGFMMPISQKDLFGLLDYCCDPNLPLSTPLGSQAVIGINTPAVIRTNGIEEPDFMRIPMYRAMYQMGLTEALPAISTENYMDFATLFAGAGSLHEAGAIVVQGLARRLSKALSTSPEDIDSTKPLHAYGVDSLLAVELRNWFAKELQADVAIFDIMGGSSIAAVGMIVAGKSGFRQAGWQK